MKHRDTVEAVVGAVTGSLQHPEILVCGRYRGRELEVIGRTVKLKVQPKVVVEVTADTALQAGVAVGIEAGFDFVPVGAGADQGCCQQVVAVERVIGGADHGGGDGQEPLSLAPGSGGQFAMRVLPRRR
ncbi:hypothetical protein [Kribbella sp. CA-294648]|uniref:hypothetical protein n=1 Tax=Kribbella sp. CA-294648 TaxID=3239948 RepID=UPI003D8DFEB6